MSKNFNQLKITAIQGFAGTAKTTYLARTISKVPPNVEFIALSFTHHAVNNLFQKATKFGVSDKSRFKTVHSFFRIDFKTGAFGGSSRPVNYIFIDEYSMIDRELFEQIIQDSKHQNVREIILAGDFLQLPRVGTIKNFIRMNTLAMLEGITLTTDLIKPLQHFDNSCLTLATKIIKKTKQYRNRNNIFLDMILKNELTNHFSELPFVGFEEACKLISSENYTMIASKYGILDRFREELYEIPQIGDVVYGTETIDDVVNGNVYVVMNVENDVVLAKDVENDERVFFEKPWKFYPIRLFTFHKSQGQTFENVIICVDDLFEFPMLYTGITRASSNVKFFTYKDKDSCKEYLKKHSGETEIQRLIELFGKVIDNKQDDAQ